MQSIVEVRAALPSVVRHVSEHPHEAVYFGVHRRPEAVIISADRYQYLLNVEQAMSQTPEVDPIAVGQRIAAYDSLRDSATHLSALYLKDRRAAKAAGDANGVRHADQLVDDLDERVDAINPKDTDAVQQLREWVSAELASRKTTAA